jgi:hypothetical protein
MRLALPTPATAIAVVLLLSACGGSGGGDGRSTSTTESRSAKRKPPVPASLGRVESGAEDMIDFAHAADRAKVIATSRALSRAATTRAGGDLRAAGVPESAIAELAARARLLKSIAPHTDFARLSLAANRISALMPEFYARYRDPVPPAVLRLDYLDREAQLRSLAGDPAAVPGVVGRLSSTWAGLRPRVIDVGGRRIAARFTRHVASMRRLRRGPPDALQREAATGLELVDALERQFRDG